MHLSILYCLSNYTATHKKLIEVERSPLVVYKHNTNEVDVFFVAIKIIFFLLHETTYSFGSKERVSFNSFICMHAEVVT